MSREINQITDHIAAALRRLALQFRDKPVMRAVISLFVAQIQDLENVGFEVLTERRLDTAVGEQLDVLGRIVGEPRNDAADDDVYRLRIRARVRANISTGSVADLYSVFALLLPESDVTITPYYPAAFTVEISPSIDPDLVILYRQFLYATKAAGVGAQLLWWEQVAGQMFAFLRSPYFMDGAHLAGATTVDVGDTAMFDGEPPPSTGFLMIDAGTPDEELIAYSAVDGTSFTTAALANNHADRTTVSLELNAEDEDVYGRGFGLAAFLDGSHSAGATTLTVDSTGGFPSSGSLVLDEGTEDEETVTYSGKTGTTFTGVSALTMDHDDRGAVVSLSTSFGGHLAGVVVAGS